MSLDTDHVTARGIDRVNILTVPNENDDDDCAHEDDDYDDFIMFLCVFQSG